MIRTQIQLREDQMKKIKAISNNAGMSISQFIRESIDLKLAQGGREEIKRRAIAVIGCGNSKDGDLAINHDKYLSDIYGETS